MAAGAFQRSPALDDPEREPCYRRRAFLATSAVFWALGLLQRNQLARPGGRFLSSSSERTTPMKVLANPKRGRYTIGQSRGTLARSLGKRKLTASTSRDPLPQCECCPSGTGAG